MNKVIGAMFIIQSNSHGPEYLEQRVNAFINKMAKIEGPFTAEAVERNKAQ